MPLEDVCIQQTALEYMCEHPFPPLFRASANSIASNLLVTAVDPLHILLVVMQERRAGNIISTSILIRSFDSDWCAAFCSV